MLSIIMNMKVNMKSILFKPDLKLRLLVVLPEIHGIDKGMDPSSKATEYTSKITCSHCVKKSI